MRKLPAYKIRKIGPGDKAWVRAATIRHWAGPKILVHGVVYEPEALQGFVAESDNGIIGFTTYNLEEQDCEIVTLASEIPKKGIGTALTEAVKGEALLSGARFLWLITTNDNIDALRFYQKRGFVLRSIHRNAIEVARKTKPEIPILGKYDIPLRDEIELEMPLD